MRRFVRVSFTCRRIKLDLGNLVNLISQILQRRLHLLSKVRLSIERVLPHALLPSPVHERSKDLRRAFADFFLLRKRSFRLHKLSLEERNVLVPLLGWKNEVHVQLGNHFGILESFWLLLGLGCELDRRLLTTRLLNWKLLYYLLFFFLHVLILVQQAHGRVF